MYPNVCSDVARMREKEMNNRIGNEHDWSKNLTFKLLLSRLGGSRNRDRGCCC
jgi:hypothetical protein